MIDRPLLHPARYSALLLAILVLQPTAGALDPLPPDDPRAGRARQVLERLLTASGQAEVELVIEDTDEPRSPRALPDRTIVLPSSLFDLCYGEDHRRWKHRKWLAGDHCLAFVLAHELTHIAEGDSQQRRLAPDATSRRSVERVNEDEADLKGLRLMWVAGFDPFDLFDPRVRDEGFFARYSRFVGATSGGEQEKDLRRRGDHLRQRLEETGDLVPYFHWGTRALQLGLYPQARAWLGRLQGVEGGIGFPSPEVLSNRGLAAYQMLAQELGQCDGQLIARFDLPVRIDPDTLASRGRFRGSERGAHCFERPDAKALKDEAEDLLRRAVEEHPSYPPAYLNLVSLHLLWRGKGSRWAAPAALETARGRLDIEADPLWINASALAEYLWLAEDRPVDRQKLRDRVLEPLRRGLRDFPQARYLARNERRIRLEQGLSPGPLTAEPTVGGALPAPRPDSKIRPGRRSPGGKFERRELTSRSLDGDASAHWLSKSSRKPAYQALTWNGEIVIGEQWVLGKPPAARWLRDYGPPDRTVPLVGGELRIHDGWAYQVENGAVVARLWFDLESITGSNSKP